MEPTTSKPNYRTITLFDRQPVRIRVDDWAQIASAKDWDNQYEFQANRTWNLRVRQHADGRAVVYGTYSTQFQGERDRAGGELLANGADIAAAIRRVGERMQFGADLIDECIADLPAQAL